MFKFFSRIEPPTWPGCISFRFWWELSLNQAPPISCNNSVEDETHTAKFHLEPFNVILKLVCKVVRRPFNNVNEAYHLVIWFVLDHSNCLTFIWCCFLLSARLYRLWVCEWSPTMLLFRWKLLSSSAFILFCFLCCKR